MVYAVHPNETVTVFAFHRKKRLRWMLCFYVRSAVHDLTRHRANLRARFPPRSLRDATLPGGEGKISARFPLCSPQNKCSSSTIVPYRRTHCRGARVLSMHA